MQQQGKPTTSLEYLLSKTYLTIIIPHLESDPLEVEHLTTLDRNDLIMKGSNEIIERGVLCYTDDSVSISFFCEWNYRTDKSTHHETDMQKNERATQIADALDSACNHCIVGDCAFVFGEDDDRSRALIEKIKKMI